jgi:uncharacterized membrane protein
MVMAGVGFKLRELLSSSDGAMRLQGAAASFFVTAGPTLFMALGFMFFEKSWLVIDHQDVDASAFMGMLVYAHISAWIGVGIVEQAMARYFSDLIYLQYLNTMPRLLVRCGLIGLALSGCICSIAVIVLGIKSPFNFYTVMLSVVLGASYACSIFINATRSYFIIIFSYLAAIVSAIAFKYLFFKFNYTSAVPRIVSWMMGQSVMIAVQVIALQREFGVWDEIPPNMTKYFFARRKYLYLGLLSALAPCIDRITFWMTPATGVQTYVGFINYPHYDLGMFYASLVALPGLTLFLVNVETGFHLAIRDEFNSVEQDGTYDEIMIKARQVNEIAIKSIFDIFFLQFSIAIVCLTLSLSVSRQMLDPKVLHIFRWGVLGYAFYLPMAVGNIFMLYFGRVRQVSFTVLFFLLSSSALSILSARMNSSAHGAGFFVASCLGFLVSFDQLRRVLKHHTAIAFTDYDDTAEVLPTPFNLDSLKKGEY